MKQNRYVEAIPVWAICYIVNGDPSGITEEDANMVDQYLTEHKIVVVSPKQDEDEYFSYYPAFGLGSNVIDCDIIALK